MTATLFIPALLTVGFLVGIRLMQSPRSAPWGNRLGASCMALALLFAFYRFDLFGNVLAWACIVFGALAGILLGQWVKTIQMPQTVALLNGLGGAASALVVAAALSSRVHETTPTAWFIATLALGVGTLTFTGSMVAALKLQGYLPQPPLFFRGHDTLLRLLLISGAALVLLVMVVPHPYMPVGVVIVFAAYGLLMALRVGGADMPVVISFLNSLSGVAASISGVALGNMLLAGVGALVGVAGMILTQLMCQAMNRRLLSVLGGFKAASALDSGAAASARAATQTPETQGQPDALTAEDIPALIQKAKTIIIIPGYGMALAQAQQAVKELMDALEAAGKDVKVAVHPVAGRMPGHMHVLLAEVDVDYDKLFDMAKINEAFAQTDVVIAVGACDVINPAATTAEGTPIYGMPILRAFEAKAVIICNLNEKPGYSGVENSLYKEAHVVTLWGDAAESVPGIRQAFQS